MTALSKSIGRARYSDALWDFPVYRAVTLYKGSAVMANSSGYAIPGADTENCRFLGVSETEVAGESSSDGDYKVRCRRSGVFAFAAGSTFGRNHVGLPVCLSDDNTVKLPWETTNRVYCGVLVDYDSSYAYVMIDEAFSGRIQERVVNANLQSTTASTTHKVDAYVCPAGRAAVLLAAKYGWSAAPSYASATLDLKRYTGGTGTAAITQIDINGAASPAVNRTADATVTGTLANKTLAAGDKLTMEIAIGATETTKGNNINVSAVVLEY
jgi:hypothetical protein